MRILVIAAVLACGCSPQPDQKQIDSLCECFATAAYEAVKARSRPPAEEKCCGKCNNTGKVRSGDGLAIVPCPCPDTCPCKQKRERK